MGAGELLEWIGRSSSEEAATIVAGAESKAAAIADEAGAESYCTPFFAQLEKTIHHVKTMKVRMT